MAEASVGLAAALQESAKIAAGEDAMVGALMDALRDTTVPQDASLPETGVGLMRERMLAPRMIVAPLYGTRSGSVLIVREDGSLRLDEHSFDSAGETIGIVSQSLGASFRDTG